MRPYSFGKLSISTFVLRVRELGIPWQVPLSPRCVPRHVLIGFKWIEPMTTPKSSFDLVSYTKGRDWL
jgi:hypothetical protein